MDKLILKQRFDSCRKTRLLASQSCLYVLQKVLKIKKKVSEVQFRNKWLKEMYKFKDIIPEGWYDPPLFGMGILFTDENHPERINYSSLRDKEYWPKADSFIKKDGLGYIFASPFIFMDNTPIIGDIGFTFYLGSNQKIRDYFRKCYWTHFQIVDAISAGQTFNEIYDESEKMLEKSGLQNNVYSLTEKSGKNLGHTIPFIDRNLNKEEQSYLASEDPDKIHKVISQARIFINPSSEYEISDNCAFTVEPRFTSSDNSKLPMCCFHTIVQFIDGKKEILTNFDGIFNLLGMEWIKK